MDSNHASVAATGRDALRRRASTPRLVPLEGRAVSRTTLQVGHCWPGRVQVYTRASKERLRHAQGREPEEDHLRVAAPGALCRQEQADRHEGLRDGRGSPQEPRGASSDRHEARNATTGWVGKRVRRPYG